MSTYLKLDAELPAGLNYLNINSISLPRSLVDVGNITNAFVFKGGLSDLVGSASISGAPTPHVDGYTLSGAGYIDTGLKESQEFLWVALVRVSRGGTYTPVISSFVEKTQSLTGFSIGNNLAKERTAIKLSNDADTVSAFIASNLTDGDFALMALSRKSEPGGYKYHYACKPAGKTLQLASSSLGTASANTESNVYIGCAPKGGAINSSTVFNFASIHNKGLTAPELNTLMNNVIGELAGAGITL